MRTRGAWTSRDLAAVHLLPKCHWQLLSFLFFFGDLRLFFLPNEEEREEAFHTETCPFQPLSPFPFPAAQGVDLCKHEQAESNPELRGGSSRLGLNVLLTKHAGIWQETRRGKLHVRAAFKPVLPFQRPASGLESVDLQVGGLAAPTSRAVCPHCHAGSPQTWPPLMISLVYVT